jgi:3-oxoacyl-[acyl-carrier protein] reductase
MISLEGRVVLITGAGGAIGAASARIVAGLGATALLHDVRAGDVERVAAELGPDAHAFASDLSDPMAVQRLWGDALATTGRIDVLVNNAGIYPAAELDAPLDEWVRVWNLSLGVNLVAPAILCREAIRTFSTQEGGGIIINMASRAAFRGEDPAYWNYAAAKAGVVAMTRTIARQNGRDGVTAFAIAPGYVDTPFNPPFGDKAGIDAAARDTGLGEVAQPQDVANVVAFLASGLARHATGTTIDVNGASYVR